MLGYFFKIFIKFCKSFIFQKPVLNLDISSINSLFNIPLFPSSFCENITIEVTSPKNFLKNSIDIKLSLGLTGIFVNISNSTEPI